MPTFNLNDITPAGAFANAVTVAQEVDRRSTDRLFQSGVFSQLKTLIPAEKALRAMATEEAARPTQRRSDHVFVPWRGGVACAAILAIVGVVLLS
jgi:hypothetical protein